jgi:hypothetical protein
VQQVDERVRGVAAERSAIRETTRASWFTVLSVVAATSALLLHLVATAPGMSVSEDSAVYVGAARNLLAGHGLTVPFGTVEPQLLTQYPPLYALLLAAHELTGLTMLEFARVINALFAIVTVVLVIRLSRSITGGSLGVAALAAVLVVSSTRMISVHAMVMSEPAMICLGTLGLYMLVRFLQPRDRASFPTLVVAGGLAGLASVTRYVGVAYGLAGLVVLVGAVRRHRCGVRAVAVYGLASLGPLAGFLGYSFFANGQATNRPLGVHPPQARDLRALTDTFGSWFGADAGAAATLVGLITIGLTLLAVARLRPTRRPDRTESHEVTSTLGSFAVSYVLVMLTAITFVDASIPGDAPRILLPLLPAVAVLLPAGLRDAVRGARPSAIALATLPVMVTAAVVVPLTTNSVRWVRYARVNGVAVTMREGTQKPLLARLQQSPRDLTIYSNDASLLYLLSNRQVIDVPPDVSVYTRQPRRGFPQELARMDRELRAGRAELVYFENGFSPSQARLLELVDLTPVHRSGIATIFVSAHRS